MVLRFILLILIISFDQVVLFGQSNIKAKPQAEAKINARDYLGIKDKTNIYFVETVYQGNSKQFINLLGSSYSEQGKKVINGMEYVSYNVSQSRIALERVGTELRQEYKPAGQKQDYPVGQIYISYGHDNSKASIATEQFKRYTTFEGMDRDYNPFARQWMETEYYQERLEPTGKFTVRPIMSSIRKVDFDGSKDFTTVEVLGDKIIFENEFFYDRYAVLDNEYMAVIRIGETQYSGEGKLKSYTSSYFALGFGLVKQVQYVPSKELVVVWERINGEKYDPAIIEKRKLQFDEKTVPLTYNGFKENDVKFKGSYRSLVGTVDTSMLGTWIKVNSGPPFFKFSYTFHSNGTFEYWDFNSYLPAPIRGNWRVSGSSLVLIPSRAELTKQSSSAVAFGTSEFNVFFDSSVNARCLKLRSLDYYQSSFADVGKLEAKVSGRGEADGEPFPIPGEIKQEYVGVWRSVVNPPGTYQIYELRNDGTGRYIENDSKNKVRIEERIKWRIFRNELVMYAYCDQGVCLDGRAVYRRKSTELINMPGKKPVFKLEGLNRFEKQ